MITSKINNTPPIIVVGMHRSGSSLLVNILNELGVFMGNDFDINNESLFFIKINDWLLQQANTSWDSPQNFNYISPSFKAVTKDIILNRLKTFKAKQYWGNKEKKIRKENLPWGWKDPRNTFTIEIWKEIFPDAKIIHIYRNPVDVIASMIKRESEFVMFGGNQTKTGLKKKMFGYKLPTYKLFNYHFKNLNKNGVYDLWKEYIHKAYSLQLSDNTSIKHIAYEDILENPALLVNQIADFCNLKTNKENIQNIQKRIDKTRKYAFLHKDEYAAFYKLIKEDELLKKLGYHQITKS